MPTCCVISSSTLSPTPPRPAPYGINYSRFIYGLKKSGIEMNRKALSELAIADPEAFKVLVETATKAL